ncbi:unnamed protein product [Fraxinus pennsylvanica]|uniref:Beta-amylase n=1 Tax=Fraxinus pennsylvanica TaxID=56036 RepID=A0AAD1ZTK0_9LAMI|nr:unnamed protein product [Fraxinus pennsylvanica]
MVRKEQLKLRYLSDNSNPVAMIISICSIPLPPWELEENSKNPDLVYTDSSGCCNPEYISLGCNSLSVLRGRTPIQAYSDYMKIFRERFKDYMEKVIVEIQVGMGPCGELRYPSYPESNGTWRLSRIGEFQCYDKVLKTYSISMYNTELTAGYYNTRHHDGYLPIAQMLGKHGVVFKFTCMEMRDGEQPEHEKCSPEGLVQQVEMATRTAGTELARENSLERYDSGAYSQVLVTKRSDSGNGHLHI